MKKKLTELELDAALRDGATQRRAVLDGLAPTYPVGAYRAKLAGLRAREAGPGVLPRLVWLVGLGGLTTAALLGLVTLATLLLSPEPSPAPTGTTIIAAHPQPETLGPSVRALLAGLGKVEAGLNQRLDPALDSATAWPGRLGEWPAALSRAEASLQRPLTQEFTALRADLRTAAEYVRQQWRVAAEDSPTDGRDPDPGTFAG